MYQIVFQMFFPVKKQYQYFSDLVWVHKYYNEYIFIFFSSPIFILHTIDNLLFKFTNKRQ